MAVGYGIFSGGLDSLLAALVLMDQGLTVRLLTFATPFFGPEKALESGRLIGLEVQAVDITGPHLEMMHHPRHGFGRFMNPCIDCHALMFKEAGRIMSQAGGDFLFSGEVLNQRPKSQTPRALQIVARESGWADSILRPLSALCLPPTLIETRGLVHRDRLQGISGRSRHAQMELAARFGLAGYPSPAGGCLLTDPAFSKRLAELAGRDPQYGARVVELLKWGRHFRLPGGSKAIVGRNERENEALTVRAVPGDLILEALDRPGPTVLVPDGRNLTSTDDDLALAAVLCFSYADARPGDGGLVELSAVDGIGRNLGSIAAVAREKKELAHLLIGQ